MSGVEILGLAASVIQIAELGAKLSVSIFTFTRKVKNANKTIDALSQEIAVTGAVLQQLGQTLSNDKSVKVCSQEAIDTAKKLVSDTEKVFLNLENLLDVQDKSNSRFRKAVNLKRLKFPFLESEIEQVQANLERLKSSLLVILNVLIFAEQLRNRETLPILQDQRELIRILAAEKDENEQRYERILKAIADRPKPQNDGQSDTSSLHSNTLTLVDPGEGTSGNFAGLAKPTGDEAGQLPVIDVPDGLKPHYERIYHHTHLVQNLLSEIDSLEYKLDHNSRGRMHTGVLDVHWKEWGSQRKLFGIHPFEKIFSGEVATYWADKAIDEQLQASQGNSAAQAYASSQSQAIEVEIAATKKFMAENMDKILERGEKLDRLGDKSHDLTLSAQSFRMQAQRTSSWYDLLSTPVTWAGSALGAVSSIPARLWQRQPNTGEEISVDLSTLQPEPSSFDSETTDKLLQGQTSPQHVIDNLTEEQKDEFKEVFELFDDGSSGAINTETLIVIMRSLGQNPSETEMQHLISQAGLSRDDKLTCEDFLKLMAIKVTESDGPETSDQPAFKVYDRDGAGMISAAELYMVMKNLGEISTEAEMQDLINNAGLTGKDEFSQNDIARLAALSKPEPAIPGGSNRQASGVLDKHDKLKARLITGDVHDPGAFHDILDNDDLGLDLGEDVDEDLNIDIDVDTKDTVNSPRLCQDASAPHHLYRTTGEDRVLSHPSSVRSRHLGSPSSLSELNDRKPAATLPLSVSERTRYSGETTGEEFSEDQPVFNPIVLSSDPENIQTELPERRWPFITDAELTSSGSFGNVEKVQIVRGHPSEVPLRSRSKPTAFDEVDALIMRYTNVGGEELMDWDVERE